MRRSLTKDEALKARLHERWHADTACCRAAVEEIEALFDGLCASYSDPHRHYHTLAHIASLFDCLETNAQLVGDAPRVAFAIWYHDIIYEIRRTDNEERSAERARRELTQMKCDAAMIDRVAALILATKDHHAGGADEDDAFFLDADFSVIGAPRNAYMAYVRGIRAEYDWLSDAEWAAGRSAFLKKISSADRVFLTDAFEERLTTRARANVLWELKDLGVT